MASDLDRGTGRTTRQLAALAGGAIFLVPTQILQAYCRRLLRQAGQEGRVRVVSPEGVHLLQGLAVSTPWAVDHSFFELANEEAVAAYRLMVRMFGQPAEVPAWTCKVTGEHDRLCFICGKLGCRRAPAAMSMAAG